MATRVVAFVSMCIALAACGGADTKTGSGGTGAPLSVDDIIGSGPMSSLGPEIVGGQEFNASSAQIAVNAEGNRTIGELRLGMPVEGRGTLTQGDLTASATSLYAQSIVIGPILAVDPAAGQLQLPGVLANIDRNTILVNIDSLAALAPGMSIEIFGLAQPQTGAILATRVARGNLPGNQISLLGVVSATTGTTATVSGLTITNIANSVVLAPIHPSPAPPSIVAANNTVRVIGTYDPVTQSIVASQILAGLTPSRPEGNLIALEGIVESTASNGDLRVASTTVRAPASATAIAAGTRIKARGRMQSGVLQATEVSIVATNAALTFNVSGPVQNVIDAQTVVVRGERIRTSGATLIGGTAADIALNRQVRIALQVDNGALVAREIRFL
ncbi:MAG: hypothetical protein JNK75_15240 [Betaproteobacteria bacterium]|nr:hypothetical protein [Betaproteobacteria bacterium]